MKNFSTEQWLALAFTAGFFVTIAALFFAEAVAKDALLVLLGVEAAGMERILGFYFGSSTGSKAKDEAMLSK